jgi:membrane-bound serine protease (ClpP class)
MTDYLTIALVLIAIGAVLLAAEIMVPTGGFLVVGAVLFFAGGVGTILYYGTTVEAAVALVGLSVGLPASGFVAVSAYRRMSLGSALDSGLADATAIDMPQLAGLAALRGRVGKALSPLRPSGTVEFDGRRYDALSEGMMIDSGAWVRCVDVKAGNLVVRMMEGPGDLDDIQPGRPSPPPLDDIDL